jgi:hypothetical protein
VPIPSNKDGDATFWAEIKNLRTRYCAPYKFVSFGPTNTIVSNLERYDIGLPEYVKM